MSLSQFLERRARDTRQRSYLVTPPVVMLLKNSSKSEAAHPEGSRWHLHSNDVVARWWVSGRVSNFRHDNDWEYDSYAAKRAAPKQRKVQGV
jgi:hypothetical protein